MISQTPNGSRSYRVRVRAALTALAFLAASWIGVTHEATTAHVRCAAHGELIDSGAAADSVAVAVRDTVAPALPSAHGHGDDHCLLASAVRQSRTLPEIPAIATAVVTVDQLVIVAPDTGESGAASIYRFAPKTSPPA